MEVLISFNIKNIEGYTDRKIQKDFLEDMLFIDVLRKIIEIINGNITLDKIAVVSVIKGLFSYDDIRKTVKEIVDMHLLEFTITKRDLVNGPNLMLKELISTTKEEDSSKDMQYGYLKPKIEPIHQPEPKSILKSPESEIMEEKVVIADYEKTLEKYREALQISEKLGDLAGKVKLLIDMGMIYNSRHEYEKAIKIFQEAIRIDTELGDMAGKAKLLNRIGIAYNLQGDSEKALENYKEALRIAEKLGDLEGKTTMLNRIGMINNSRNEYEKKLEPEVSPQPEPILEPQPGSAPKSTLNRHNEVTEDLKKIFSEAMERKKVEPPAGPPSGPPAGFPAPKSAPPPGSAPGGPPKSPQSLRGAATEELKSLFKIKEEKKSAPPGAGSAPPPAPARHRALAKSSIPEPTPPPSPSPPPSKPVDTSADTKSFSFKAKKKGKKMRASLRSFAEEVEEEAPILEEEIKDEVIVDDFEEDFEEKEEFGEREEEMLSDFVETEAPTELPPPLKSDILPELMEVAKEIETRKEYQKNIAIEYYDKMNPKKYYPLIVDISDIEQATTISEENVLTGERKTQVKEKMAVLLKSSIVKVKPMFPGCSIVPEERYTDFDKKEDKLTFYVTPLVDDEIEDGRIEFIDSEGNIFHSAPTPTKVEDPRYARMIALYGGLASFLPKILEVLGFGFATDLEMATLLPFLQPVLGDMNLSNFIGISGIMITIIICIITVIIRKPNSVKKKFKVDRVGRLKSSTKASK